MEEIRGQVQFRVFEFRDLQSSLVEVSLAAPGQKIAEYAHLFLAQIGIIAAQPVQTGRGEEIDGDGIL